jgi:hypothetical protein
MISNCVGATHFDGYGSGIITGQIFTVPKIFAMEQARADRPLVRMAAGIEQRQGMASIADFDDPAVAAALSRTRVFSRGAMSATAGLQY